MKVIRLLQSHILHIAFYSIWLSLFCSYVSTVRASPVSTKNQLIADVKPDNKESFYADEGIAASHQEGVWKSSNKGCRMTMVQLQAILDYTAILSSLITASSDMTRPKSIILVNHINTMNSEIPTTQKPVKAEKIHELAKTVDDLAQGLQPLNIMLRELLLMTERAVDLLSLVNDGLDGSDSSFTTQIQQGAQLSKYWCRGV